VAHSTTSITPNTVNDGNNSIIRSASNTETRKLSPITCLIINDRLCPKKYIACKCL
jgi:hypothetical protein